MAVALFARAWIEIAISSADEKQSVVALFARAWIEIFKQRLHIDAKAGSRPLCEGVD